MQVRTRIKKWGNGLALRLSGSMAAVPNFNAGDPIVVEVSEQGLLVRHAERLSKTFPYTEAELLEGLTPYTAHADAIFAVDPGAAPFSSEDVYRALGDQPRRSVGEDDW